jgi:8-oxo-dGTP diphosphatase
VADELPAALKAALADADAATLEYEEARSWFRSAAPTFCEPLAVEVWVFDPSLQQVLLVAHRWRGWVPPGGRAEPGEAPREAAARELAEEAGIMVELLPQPAAAMVRSYHADWPVTLGLTYAAIVDAATELAAEPGQPAAWHRLDRGWESSFPEDRERMVSYLERVRSER